jgi:hypothetical protein
MKKDFINKILYESHFLMFRQLEPEQVYHIINKIGDDEYELTDPVCKGLWISLQRDFRIQEENYLLKIEKNRENGKKGGRPSKQTSKMENPSLISKTQDNPKNPTLILETQHKPNNLKEKEEREKKYKDSSIAYFSANTETNTNSTHTRVLNFNEFFKPVEVNKKSQLIFDNLDDSTRKEADRQAELELEKLFNKNL